MGKIDGKYLGVKASIDDIGKVNNERGGSFSYNPKEFAREKKKILKIIEHSKTLTDPVLVDIGANYGSYSLTPLINPNLRVHSFEVIPRVYRSLCNNIELNGLQDKVTAYNEAIFDSVKEFNFLVVENHTGASRLTEKSTGLKVLTKTLDSFNISKMDILKIDVEGAELPVLKGGINTLITCKPSYIQIEIKGHNKRFNYSENDIFNFLDVLGYDKFKWGDDYIFTLRDDSLEPYTKTEADEIKIRLSDEIADTEVAHKRIF